MERATETPKADARPAHSNSIGERSPPAPPTASASTQRHLRADGLGGEPSATHRLDLWLSVISVELDHLVVGGDTGGCGARRAMPLRRLHTRLRARLRAPVGGRSGTVGARQVGPLPPAPERGAGPRAATRCSSPP